MVDSQDSDASGAAVTARRPGGRRATALGLAILGVSLLAATLLVGGQRPLMVPYWYALPAFNPAIVRLLLTAAVLIIYILVAFRLHAGPAAAVLLWAFIGGLALPVMGLSLLGNPQEVLLMRTISGQTTGGFSIGVELTGEMIRNWPDLMADWRVTLPHVAISLPGWPLIYAGLTRSFSEVPTLAHTLASPLRMLQCHQWGFNTLGDPEIASAWFGVLSPLWSALTVLPLFGLGRQVGGRPTARLAVLLWPLVPAATLFIGTLNSLYPFLASIVVLALWTGMSASTPQRRGALLITAGALMGGSILLNLALAPLLLFCGLLALALPWLRAGVGASSRLPRSVVAGLWFSLGLIAVFAAYWALVGHSPLRVIIIALGVHFGMERAYLPGVGLHVWDFVLFMGLPLVGLGIIGAAFRPAKGEPLQPVHALALTLALTLAILLLSGTAQGEVGRVWLFFMPFTALLAGHGLRRLPSSSAALFVAAQAIWLLMLAGTIAPVDTWLAARPAYADVATPPLAAPVTPIDARFGDVLQLTGFQSEADSSAQTLRVALHWKVLERMDRPYYFSAVLVGPDGQVLPGVNWQPFEKRYPTICWAPGSSEVVDQISLPLGADYATGNWWLSLSTFSLEGSSAQNLLPVVVTGAEPDNQVGLGPLPIR